MSILSFLRHHHTRTLYVQNPPANGFFFIVLARKSPTPTIDKWSPALQIRTVLLSVQALLSSPNPDDPLANDVAQHWKENENAAIQTAQEWTRKYATA